MHHGDDYFDAFKAATEKSVKWGVLESAIVRRVPEAGRARDHLALVARLVDSNPLDSQAIRLSCGQIHSWLFKNLWANGAGCFLTVGDIEVSGKREYGTSYQRLKQELRGAHRDTDGPYPFHAWLTFPDMQVIDANYFIYKHHDLLPEPWRWSEYVVCSDHPFAAGLDIKYIPMLVGRADLVDRMIFERS